MLLFPKKRTSAEIIEAYNGEEWFDPEILQPGWQKISVESFDGTLLSGQLLPGHTDECIIFTHGITGTRMSALRMLEPFMTSGWSIVLYDQRGHGESSRSFPAYGCKEKYDLQQIVSYVKTELPASRISLYGISMGAATVLQYLPLSEDIYRCAADSSFSSLPEQLIYRFRSAGLPGYIHRPLLFLSGTFVRFFGGFSIWDCRPADSAAAAPIPLLLIHASGDEEVPVAMCTRIAESRSSASLTKVLITDKGGHTEACTAFRRDWTDSIRNFFIE